MHRREGHAAAIVHLDVERDGLEGTLAHAADVLDEIPGAHRPRTGGFYDEAVRSRGCRPVLSEELHREGLTDAGDHAHRHATPAGNVPRGGARRGVHGPLRANHAHRGARRQGTRGAAADRLARGSVNLGVDGQELRGVIERTKLEKVALPHRGRQSQGHVGTGEAAHALATAVAATATDEGVLELVGRDDLTHQLASVVRPLVAHHVVVGGTEEVGVGEVAVERPPELAMAQGVRLAIVDAGGQRVEGAPVRGDHGVHVVGGLHATLDLERAHARVAHPGKVVDGAEVLGAERPGATGRRDHLARLVDEVVRQTARLSAETAVRRATARQRAHHADARVAEAERPVAEALELDALAGNPGDLGQRELARERHPVDAEIAAPGHTARVVDVRLRGDVRLDLRPGASDLGEKSPVLDDEGVGAEEPRPTHELEHAGQLGGGHRHVDGDVDPDAGEMRAAAGLGERLVREVAGASASVEVVAEAAVDGIGARRERGVERLGAARGGEQLGHAMGMEE